MSPVPLVLTDTDPLEDVTLAEILAVLRQATGIDFGGYRRSMIARRIANRMMSANERSAAAYLARLRTDPAEPSRLVDRLAIKVSRFFRDPQAFALLRRELAARVRGDPPLAIWSAGVGLGEEPYSLAMLLEELEAPEGAHVVASDVDPSALAAMDRGIYTADALQALPDGARERHFLPVRGSTHGAVSPAVRRRVRAVLHDLTAPAAPPGGPFDVVCCRNVLIYLQHDVQARAFAALLGALRQGGVLCLGEAEWPPPVAAAELDVIDRKGRLFVKR